MVFLSDILTFFRYNYNQETSFTQLNSLMSFLHFPQLKDESDDSLISIDKVMEYLDDPTSFKIGLEFNDNDFTTTFINVFCCIRRSECGWDLADKKLISTIIKELSYPCYLLYQNSTEDSQTKRYIDTLVQDEYLFLGDDVKPWILSKGCKVKEEEKRIYYNDDCESIFLSGKDIFVF